jgi:uncharacterized protein
MPSTKPSRAKRKAAARPSAFEKASKNLHHDHQAFPNVSPRWLLAAAAIVFLGALACAWLTLCLLYWQGSWQLLYHPKAEITRTPASASLAFEQIHFADTETGIHQLTGWWLPNASSHLTVLYLHGADGNLSDSVPTLAALHSQNLAVFAFDYRGYGQSQPARPNEKQLRQDAEWALTWLTLTRSISAKSIVVYGSGLGANLAAELAADHSELAGVILDQPLQYAMAPVFNDPRTRLVPTRLLTKDRYELNAPAASLRIPSLWLLTQPAEHQTSESPEAYKMAHVQKTVVWLQPPFAADRHFAESLQRWLDDLQQAKK